MPLTTAVADYIFDQTLGCRYGTTTAGAAYGFMDIVGEGQSGGPDPVPPQTVLSWIQDPNQPEFEPRWDNRLWNTCGKIVDLSPAGTVLLVTKAAPSAERYLFLSDAARGDRYSFRKCSRLQPDSAIVATIPYGDGVAAVEQEDIVATTSDATIDIKTVQKLYDAINLALKKLAGEKSV